jgi:hypothetical protein
MNNSKLYLTQIIFVNEGKEDIFNAFEAIAIPKIAEYNGELIYRVRPESAQFINDVVEKPYEIHFVSFESEADFKRFMQDEERKNYLFMFKESVREVLLVAGQALSR